jgi:hypothetical protein
MNRLERFYKIDQLLQEQTVVARAAFLRALEVSPATFKRDLEYMRDRFHAPVVWDADLRGYRYEKPARAARRFELPGLWFTEDEAYALVTMQHLLASLDHGGLIGPHIAPLIARLDAILGEGDATAAEIRKRIRLLTFGSRKLPRVLRAQHQRALRAGSLAAAPRPLSRELVPRHVVPPAQRPAQLLRGRHTQDRDRRRAGKGSLA